MLLLSSYQRLTGRTLLDAHGLSAAALVSAVDEAPFALVSHGTEADPIFNYGNLTALKLFGMSWAEFTALPSRYSAEQPNRAERERLLHEVKSNGFIDHYSGVRIAKGGGRFAIERATVWNVVDGEGRYQGQAATFAAWHFL
jgi:hypothetical protein